MRGQVIAVPVASWDDVSEGRLTRPDGRVVAWTESAVPDGIPLLRVPGTPGSRWSIRADRAPWVQRRLRVITSERPGLGASTRLPGRGFQEHAEDLAAILDHLGIERVFVKGASGAAPHILAFLACHPDRAVAATIEVGAAPLDPDEVDGMVQVNRDEWYLIQAGDRDAVREHTLPFYDALVADPVAGCATSSRTPRPPIRRSWPIRRGRPASRAGCGKPSTATLRAGSTRASPSRRGGTRSTCRRSPPRSPGTTGTRTPPHPSAQQPGSWPASPQPALVEIADAGHLATYHLEGQILDELLSRDG